MSSRTFPDGDRTRTMAFLLWGWALLLLVLLSAAPTAAQPVARSVGSAFDPSTVSVAVGPSKRHEIVWIKKLRSHGTDDDAPDRPSRRLLIGEASAPGSGEATVPAMPFDRADSFRISSRAAVRSPPARAPPRG